jgi:hypothetical protein
VVKGEFAYQDSYLKIFIKNYVCEECRRIKDCEYCFCEGLPDKAVVFLTVNTHQLAYEVK